MFGLDLNFSLKKFRDTYTHIKKNYTNVYIVIVSIVVAMWFKSLHRIIDIVFPYYKSILSNLIIIIICTVILLLGDGSLDEIYSYDEDNLQNRIGGKKTQILLK